MQRALRLLEAVGSHADGAPAKQLARETHLPLPTAYHLLRTLTHEGYLRRDNGVFLLGDAVGQLAGGAAQNRRSKIANSLAHWRDTIGVPVYFAVYEDGEIELVAVADTPAAPAVDEWADFRETGHAHAIGQCLLSQLDERARRDHLDRHPVQPITPYTVCDGRTLLERLEATERMQPVVERQEYALGTVCAAVPVAAGSAAAVMAISVPLHQEERLLPAVHRLRLDIGRLFGSLVFSISI
ncbi:IclR family transcriptional regulator C-terminal domain-containing protein [Streptomyces ficellus]|uniref:IclR family transcriptional regulator C-terminal domain-containing protein n=1 Tax=Streptomyces ficellus TaxID=1977088 RepID=A0ABT7ZE23_9ACTN|nr:IclR family transcriptional regulator C-terminal domain-containing protein [Streptomyces ficellus]MDN3297768.1 IclR family transcriptional regulator C-terminal domain-containing protein [Streptomyces ficellus]